MSISSSALLVELNISVWPASKLDREITDKVNSDASAVRGASQTKKNLFAGTSLRKDISDFAARVRLYHNKHTLPWADKGERMLPTALFMDYKQTMNRLEAEFDLLVDKFLDKYDTLVASAAFQLGTLFDRTEYPSRNQVANKFRMHISFCPLPTSGDFRLDIEAEVQRDLIEQYEKRAVAQVTAATQDSWTRLYNSLKRLSDRLVIEEDGKKRIFHDTIVTGALEMCELLTHMNVLKDPSLEKARRKLEEVLSGVTPKELREEDGTRLDTKRKVDEILAAFDWGIEDDEQRTEPI